MILEVGKVYINKQGDKVTIDSKAENFMGYHFIGNNEYTFKEDGTHIGVRFPTVHDLIKEHTEELIDPLQELKKYIALDYIDITQNSYFITIMLDIYHNESYNKEQRFGIIDELLSRIEQ